MLTIAMSGEDSMNMTTKEAAKVCGLTVAGFRRRAEHWGIRGIPTVRDILNAKGYRRRVMYVTWDPADVKNIKRSSQPETKHD